MAAAEPTGAELDRLMPELYGELKKLAIAQLGRGGSGGTLQPTALVHEAYLRLHRAHGLDLSNRRRFFALAGKVMRQVIVDHARVKGREKRGGGAVTVSLSSAAAASAAAAAPPALDALALDEALTRLAALDPRQVEIVELRYFAGLEVEEVAELVALSPTTVKRESAMACAFLLAQLGS
jgi:RNA polymerase sigma factor (TIGR02999 family)